MVSLRGYIEFCLGFSLLKDLGFLKGGPIARQSWFSVEAVHYSQDFSILSYLLEYIKPTVCCTQNMFWRPETQKLTRFEI